MSDAREIDARIWILIPIFNHGTTIAGVVRRILEAVDAPVLIVDDGSDLPTREVLSKLEAVSTRVRVHRLEPNRGKGVALRAGFRLARDGGATHVIHLDADGQHEIGDLPRFVAAVDAEPNALILGKPIFDASVPRVRLYGRQFSRVVVWLCTFSFAIDDPLCGFRAVPLDLALPIVASETLGDRMEFEPGFAVVAYWAGAPVRNLETRVRYLPGGLSNFDGLRDTLRMARLYARLLARSLAHLPSRLTRPAESA